MNTRQKNQLELEIAQQEAVIRFAGYKYAANLVSRYVTGLIVMIGFVIFPIWEIMIPIGLILIVLAIYNLNKTYKELQSEEKKLLELKNRLISQL